VPAKAAYSYPLERFIGFYTLFLQFFSEDRNKIIHLDKIPTACAIN